MAKKDEAPKIILERIYSIALRRQTLKVPPFMKANKAAKSVRQFISKHMKSENVLLGRYLNLKIWEHGARSPPHHVKVSAIKDAKGKVFVELVDAPKEKPKADEAKKSANKEDKIVKDAEFTEKQEEKLEKHVEEAKEEKAKEAKKLEEEEIKELHKEHPPKHAPKARQKPKKQETHPPAPKSL